MADSKFLIWLDILGFEGLARSISKETGIEAKKVRKDFINTINERVAAVECKKEVLGKNYGERDDWLLVTENLDLALKVTFEILDHNTHYRNCEKIPLEIAIGTGKYDRWGSFYNKELIVEDSTIDFLKINIINYYHEWFKKVNSQKSLNSTFIVLTDSAYKELNKLDKMQCHEIGFKFRTKEGLDENAVFFSINVDVIRQRGMIFEFLEKIGRPFSKLYDRIDSLYVPPIEYQAIKRSLSLNKIVFITGTPEYGKTYTAVRLLWEYFCRGYEPLWMAGGEILERLNLRKSLEEIEVQLRQNSKRIIYFEDPFGKTRYETTDTLEREIGTIIESIHKSTTTYVIITSREEIFKEFEREQLSSIKVRRFEETLNIKKPSYDSSRRISLLMKWAQYKDCRWLEDSGLRQYVRGEIADLRKLPTPLSIRDFVYSTVDVNDRLRLSRRIEEKSKETTKSFSKQIENMTTDKVLFLLFPFIAPLAKEVVKSSYNRLVRKLHLTKPGNFAQILGWFADDKIALIKGKLAYSHPSYREAVADVLTKSQCATAYKSILSKLVLDLVSIGCAKDVSWSLTEIFPAIDGNTKRRLITELEKQDASAKGLASLVSSRFNEIPRNILGNLLSNLANREQTARDVALVIFENFDKIPEPLRSDLLTSLADKSQAARAVASIVLCNFSKLPADSQKIVFKLAASLRTCEDVGWAVFENFDKIPEPLRSDLLTSLADKSQAAKSVAVVVLHNFEKFSKKTIRGLLTKLEASDEASWILANIIAKYSSKLSGSANEILLNCVDKNDSGMGVIWAVEDNFQNLGSELRNSVLIKLADKCPERTLEILITHYDSFSPAEREKLLQRISVNDSQARILVVTIREALKKGPRKKKFILSESLRPRLWTLLNGMASSSNVLLRKKALLLTQISGAEPSEGHAKEWIVIQLCRDENKEIREKAKEIMKEMRAKTSKRYTRYLDSEFSILDAFHEIDQAL
jgi:hypothetical protein